MSTENAEVMTEVGASVTEAPKRRKSPGIVAQNVIDKLSLAERLAAVAQKPEYAATLDDNGLGADIVASLVQNIRACRAGIIYLADRKATKSEATGTETDERTLLLNGLQKAQTLAKLAQTLDPSKTILKSRYLIGTPLRDLSRPDLESAADQIIAHLKADNFKGMPPAKIAELEAHLTAWRTADGTQSSAQSSAITITTRQELLDVFDKVEHQRRAIQLAADAAYPYTDKANAGIRGEFALPKNGPLKKT
jgi:hypothetical protein